MTSLREALRQLIAFQLSTDHLLATLIHAVHLKYALCQVDADRRNLHFDASFSFGNPLGLSRSAPANDVQRVGAEIAGRSPERLASQRGSNVRDDALCQAEQLRHRRFRMTEWELPNRRAGGRSGHLACIVARLTLQIETR